MRKEKGFSLMELLVTVILLGIILSAAIPPLARAKDDADRAFLFNGEFRNLSHPLTPAQKEVLRPVVEARIAALCPGAKPPEPLRPDVVDPDAIQQQIDKVVRYERPSDECQHVRAIAKREGF